MHAALLLLALFCAFPAEAKISIDWVTIGQPGNSCKYYDGQGPTGCYGSVGYVYRISKYELTAGQFVEFLNAVAADDPNRLYTQMHEGSRRDIDRHGTAPTFTYSVRAGYVNKPKQKLSYVDALRFANWLHNGQPIGAQDNTTTEDGAYTITPQSIIEKTIVRNRGARFFLASEDEWFKAAHYNPVSESYWQFPMRAQPTGSPPSILPNTANCDHAVRWVQIGPNVYQGNDESNVTDVGSYINSASAYGTFDQGGNLKEWTETIHGLPDYPHLHVRGGGNGSYCFQLRAWSVVLTGHPLTNKSGHAVRLARIPELEIDIEPERDSNAINLMNPRRLIRVAIPGSDSFDASAVDPHSLEFGPQRAQPVHSKAGHLEDVNDDGYMDLLSHYRVQDTGIALGEPEACVTGETFDGTPLLGCDLVDTLNP